MTSLPPPSPGKTPSDQAVVIDVLKGGDPVQVQALIHAGVDLAGFSDNNGYDALLTAMFGRDLHADTHLIPLLRTLIAAGVPLDGESTYRESALSVLSQAGRFDAVLVLLEAGADERLLAWTPLHRAIALGTAGEVQARLATAPGDIERKDRWSRTPFLLALAVGRTEIAAMLADAGADQHAVDHVGRSAIFHAVLSRRTEAVQWLLDRGVAVDGTGAHGSTALVDAVERDDVAMVELLLAAGADPNHRQSAFSALASAVSREVANRLLEAGADPTELTNDVQRLFTGGQALSEDEAFAGLGPADFDRDRTRRFGRANPEPMAPPFWQAMLRSGFSGYEASRHFKAEAFRPDQPVWCAQRFGQSMTLLPDGRVVQVAGEHEDSYDPDFCIYNDVFVHHPDGTLELFGYPEDVFPPTDFHTATLVGNRIVLIGSLGYPGTRIPGTTPVYTLDTRSWRIDPLPAGGEAPGWIYKHCARRRGDHEIVVTGGTVLTAVDGKSHEASNADAFVLDLARATWRRESGGG